MSLIEKNLPVTMVRDSLDDIPRHVMPPGYSVRWFQPGDEAVWTQIQSAADHYNDITVERFEQEFGADVDTLRQRQCYLLDSGSGRDCHGEPIGTATAWYAESYNGLPHGRIHWVAIAPAMQGRGLARPLLTVVCDRLGELGHERVYLSTESMRLPAIHLYLTFSFLPEIRHDQDREIWIEIRQRLGH